MDEFVASQGMWPNHGPLQAAKARTDFALHFRHTPDRAIAGHSAGDLLAGSKN